MIGIDAVVMFVIYVLGCGLIFGLLNYLIDYVSENFPVMAPFAKIAKIGLVVLAVFVLINIILSLMGRPIVVMR